MKRLLGLAPLLSILSLAVAGENWPQFRGPTGQGHAESTGLPTEWSETKNITWKTPIPGRGWSSPVVEDGQIWLTTATDEGRSLHAICVDAASGAIVHDVPLFRIDEPIKVNAKNSHASPTPVIEPGRVYVHFGTQGTACLDTTSGKVLWTNQELVLDHKEGPGSSPILWNNLLIVNCDGTDLQYVAALDKNSGQLVWKTDRPGPIDPNPDFCKAYSTPLVIRRHGTEQLVSTGAHQVIAYDPASGRPLWRLPYRGFSNVPRPVAGPDLVYICTGYNKPQLWAIRPPQLGHDTPDIVWQLQRQVPANPSPILLGDQLYIVSDQGVLTCLDAQTGQELWAQRLGGGYSASPVLAEGRIYIPCEDGQTYVIRPGSSAYELIACNTLEGTLMASPAVVGRAIYLRSDTHLYRIEDAAQRTASVQ